MIAALQFYTYSVTVTIWRARKGTIAPANLATDGEIRWRDSRDATAGSTPRNANCRKPSYLPPFHYRGGYADQSVVVVSTNGEINRQFIRHPWRICWRLCLPYSGLGLSAWRDRWPSASFLPSYDGILRTLAVSVMTCITRKVKIPPQNPAMHGGILWRDSRCVMAGSSASHASSLARR
jgi:hypothetical protein